MKVPELSVWANQKRRGKMLKGLAKDTAQIFKNYNWTGNVRELRNVIERASILEDSEWITTNYLPQDLLRSVGQTSAKNFASFSLPPPPVAGRGKGQDNHWTKSSGRPSLQQATPAAVTGPPPGQAFRPQICPD